MASAVACRSLALVLAIVVAVSVTGASGSSKSLNITNNCAHTVWPAISSGSSSAAPYTTGFELAPGESRGMPLPSGWSGRVWGRTLCSTGTGMGKFTCLTGDCGSGRQDCAGGNAARPVTLAQFTLDGNGGGMDLYDVSLVDGFNLPMVVAPPQGAAPGGICALTGCPVDLNVACPAELRATFAAGAAVACKSACQAFGSPQYCCTGAYGNPNTCKPSVYSKVFKKACPLAVSYAYDGGAIFTCGGGDTGGGTYTITFCPASATNRGYTTTAPGTGNLKEPEPLINGSTSTPYTGDSQVGAASQPSRITLIVGVLSAVTAALGVVTAVVVLCKTCGSQDR